MGKMRQFRRALRAGVNRPLAYQINEGRGALLSEMFERIIRGGRVSDVEITEAMTRDDDESSLMLNNGWSMAPVIIPGGNGKKGTAIVPVRGVANYDVELQPVAFSTLLLSQTMNELAANPEVGTIILDIDSPGGEVTGTPEAADAVYAARRKKKVVAIINPLAASAAYWIASQANEIISVKSGDAGSIGVFMLHADCSAMMEGAGVKPTFIFAGKHKVEGNPFEPLSAEAREHMQGEVDKIYRDFIKAVARGRNTTISNVEENFGQGRVMMAPDAKRVGLIDEISTLEAAMGSFGLTLQAPVSRRRGQAEEEAEVVEVETEAKVEAAQTQEVVETAVETEVETVVETAVRTEAAEQPSQILLEKHWPVGAEAGILYVSKPWPNATRISVGLLKDADVEHMVLSEDGKSVAIILANGSAVYVGCHDGITWSGTLAEGSTFTPPPPPPTVKIDLFTPKVGVEIRKDKDGNIEALVHDDLVADQEAASKEAKKASDARRRRLALLRA